MNAGIYKHQRTDMFKKKTMKPSMMRISHFKTLIKKPSSAQNRKIRFKKNNAMCKCLAHSVIRFYPSITSSGLNKRVFWSVGGSHVARLSSCGVALYCPLSINNRVSSTSSTPSGNRASRHKSL